MKRKNLYLVIMMMIVIISSIAAWRRNTDSKETRIKLLRSVYSLGYHQGALNYGKHSDYNKNQFIVDSVEFDKIILK